jgi:putative solute:sodium symporter small subunit
MTMQLTEKHKEYWRRNMKMTAILLVIWFVVTYVVGWYARELNELVIFGFPFGFYMGAQGSLVIYVIMIFYYAIRMNKLDKEYDVAEGEG